MTWVKLPDTYPEDPRLDEAGPLALALHTAALCHCSRNLTDGRLVRGAARRLLALDEPDDVAAALVEVGLWEVVDEGKAYRLVDYLEHQPSRDQVERQRAESARTTERSRRHNKGDHELCDPQRCWVLRDRSDGESVTRHGTVSDPLPSRPVPSRPLGRDGGGEGSAGAGSRSAPPAGGPSSGERPILGPLDAGVVPRVFGGETS